MTQHLVDAPTGAQPSESSSCTGCSGEPSVMPIAIVGMGCRLPGTATSPDGLWNMVSKGMSGWSQSAGSRFKMDAFYHPASEMNGAFSTKGLYLLRQDITHFDNQFFNISPNEAKAIDPQQRLLLEVAYEAFEHAGITSESLSSSNTGVYCAVSNHDYENIQGRDPEQSPMYRFTGTGTALVANRISYCFNLSGPSITLDTACSGSLVAVHEACKAIRCGEIQQALVGGSNLILDPERISVMSSLQFLSDHGRCYSFDSRGDGFGKGEGVAAIVLKPLNNALRDGDPIQAVIRGTAVNSDGRTAGITMPSKDAQVSMMRKAYAEAELDPRNTNYVEAHGTGTQVGDKIESAAIAEVFSPGRPEDSAIYVGSVKTNIGHAESAAGLAGLLKSVLILKNGKIPPNLNFAKRNKHLRLEDWKMKIPQRLSPWPENDFRRASVNSFGYGGTNAHVILESPESYMLSNSTAYRGGLATPMTDSGNGSDSATTSSDNLNGDWIELGENGDLSVGKRDESCPLKRYLLVLTHDNEGGITRVASDLKRHFSKVNPEHNNILESLAYTLSLRRSRHSFRVAASATNLIDLLVSFENVSRGIIRPQKALDDPKICFAFTGQGAQWPGMGRELFNNYPLFAKSMSSAEIYLSSLGAEWELLTELNKEPMESRVNEAALSQPCCTAIQLALIDLMRSWGIRPHVVCGHSSGEIAAAYAAGFLTRYDALNVAFHRGKCVANLARQHPEFRGRMLAAGVSEEKAQQYISKAMSKSGGKVAVACVNSPSSVTLSGDECAVNQSQADLESDGVFNRLLQVDIAYHSHHMKAIQDEYRHAMGDLSPVESNGGIRMVSSVTGTEIYAEQMTADYWVRNLVSPVRFSDALEHSITIHPDNLRDPQIAANIILEIGPHSALKGPIKQTLKTMGKEFSGVSCHSALIRNIDAVESTTDMAGELFARGVSVCFDAINDPCQTSEKKVLTSIPSYNWQHTTSHWSEGRVSLQYRQRQFPRHDILGVLSHDCLPTEPTWRNFVRQSELPWLKGHIVDGQTIFPASGYICMALEALRQVTIASGRAWKNILCRFRQIVLERALLIPDDSFEVETYFTLRKFSTSARELSSDWEEFRVFSVSHKGEVAEHCRGLVSTRHSGEVVDADASRESIHYENTRREELITAKTICRESVDPKHLYESLRSLGVDYTSPFANLTEINSGGFTSLCRLTIPETKQSMPGRYQQPHVIHPGTLDSFFHTAFPVVLNNGTMTSSCVLSSIDALDISSDISNEPATSFLAHAKVAPNGRQRHLADIIITEPSLNDLEVISIKGLGLTLSGSRPSSNEAERVKQYHQIEWSMDSSSAKNEDVRRICRTGLPAVSAFEHRATCDHYVEIIIHNVLTSITPLEELNMVDHHKKFMQWMRARKPIIIPNANADLALREKVKLFGIDGEMLVHVGDHLVDILKGKVDPLSVLMQDDLLFRVYASENMSRCNLQLVNYIRQLQFKNPQMRVLEIGAGTANTAAPLLEGLTTDTMGRPRELAKFEKYVFTDISSGFFEKAKVKLEQFGDLVEYKKLNIEKPVHQQGFEVGSFDLIVASNVLHATASISSTLDNVRALLKPEGKLALIEFTNAHSVWPLMFGPLPGWWLGASDGRLDSPLLRLEAWNEALIHAGFSGVDVALKDYEPAYEHELSLMVSSALDQIASGYPDNITIICGEDEKGIANALSDLITTTRKSVQIQKKSLNALVLTDTFYVVLLEIVVPFLALCSQADFHALMSIFLKAKGILWVTRGAAVESCDPDKALITGLSRTLRSEDHSLSLTTLDLDPTSSCPSDMAQHIDNVLSHVICTEGFKTHLPEYEYAVRNGTILIPRLVEDCLLDDFVQSSLGEKEPTLDTINQTDRALGLEIETPGLLETLYWTDSALHHRSPSNDEVRIRVSMAALNFRDLMTAMGQLEDLSSILVECSGTVIEVGRNASTKFTVGDRVCAIGLDGVATLSNIEQHLVHRIPDEMSFEAAAAIPISYATALYALRDVARIQPGESILIHSAAGAFGQAAIALAKHFNAGKIFVTVGNAEKKSLIIESFGIPEENIFSSRGLAFASGIRRQTQGQGVDLVLNTLRGEAKRESQNCLNQFGRFIELGKKDILTNTYMEMQYLLKNSTFAVVDLFTVAQYRPLIIQDLIKSAIELIHKQEIKLLQPITVAPVSRLEDTFRLMQTGKHMGKLIMELDSQSLVKVQPQTPSLAKLNNGSTYLVAGGLGGLGRAVIRYLVTLGAKNIATLSRSGAHQPSKEAFVKEMRDMGVNLIIHEGDVTNMEDIERLKEATREYPIRGVVQGAMILQDSVMSNMTYAQWQAALGPKVTGTWNLHSAFGKDLDFFILLSSATAIVGSRGQGNYAAGGTFQDAFARYRASLNLPVRTIDLSSVESEGYAAENDAAAAHAHRQGFGSMKLGALFTLLNHAIVDPTPRDISSAQVVTGTRRADPASYTNEEASIQRADPMFSHTWIARSSHVASTMGSHKLDLRTTLSEATSRQGAVEAIQSAVVGKLSQLLAMPVEDISGDQSVSSYGADSLVAVELRNWVSKQLEAQVQIFELMSGQPICALAKLFAGRSHLVPQALFVSG